MRMGNDCFEEFMLAEKERKRTEETVEKAGYRRGFSEGSDSVLQDGFNRGYAEAFKIAFALGKYKGLVTALPAEEKFPPEIERILGMTKRGACIICERKVEFPIVKEESLQDVIMAQRKHSINTLETLYKYFEPLFKKYKLEVDNFPSFIKDF